MVAAVLGLSAVVTGVGDAAGAGELNKVRGRTYVAACPPVKALIPRRQIAAEFVLLLPAGCGVVAADVIGAEPARPGSPVTACDFAFRCKYCARFTEWC